MKQRRWRLAAMFIAAAVGGAAVLTVVLALLLGQRTLQARQAELPVVPITSPANGEHTRTGSRAAVSATVLGGGRLPQVELWANGEQEETWLPEAVGGAGTAAPFASYAGFSPIVYPGANMLFARAVTEAGVIAQSEPVVLFGEGDLAWSTDEVWLEPGLDLESAAQSLGVDPGQLLELNPGLQAGLPPSGALVVVPAVLPPALPAPGSAAPGVAPQQPLSPLVNLSTTHLAALLPAQPPAGSPGQLLARVRDCHVTLSWQDNAADELSYEVWRTRVGGAPRRVASRAPVPGQGAAASYAFVSPAGEYSLWVEATGPFGRQPSTLSWLAVDPPCASGEVPLQVDVLDVLVSGGYERAYCYVSLEGAPEVRIPADRGAFIPVNPGSAGAGERDTGVQTVIPTPDDDSIDLSGECWAWAGDTLDNLGTFQQSLEAERWDGERIAIRGGNFEIGLSIEPQSSASEQETYSYEDPTLAPPYNLRVAERGDPSDLDEVDLAFWYWDRDLSWDWSGSGVPDLDFQILVDGAAYMTVSNAAQRTQTIRIPRICGDPVRLQVVAVSGEAHSKPSAALEVTLPSCRYVLDVWFEKVQFWNTYDPEFSSQATTDCDTFELYSEIAVNDQVHAFGSTNFPYATRCGEYHFDEFWHLTANPGHFRIVQPEGPIDLAFRATFWDQDDGNPDDRVASIHRTLWFPPGYDGPSAPSQEDTCLESDCSRTGDADTQVTFCYRLSVTP